MKTCPEFITILNGEPLHLFTYGFEQESWHFFSLAFEWLFCPLTFWTTIVTTTIFNYVFFFKYFKTHCKWKKNNVGFTSTSFMMDSDVICSLHSSRLTNRFTRLLRSAISWKVGNNIFKDKKRIKMFQLFWTP